MCDSLCGRGDQYADEEISGHVLADDDGHPVHVWRGISAEAIHQNANGEAEYGRDDDGRKLKHRVAVSKRWWYVVGIETHSVFREMDTPVALRKPQVDFVTAPSAGQEGEYSDGKGTEVDEAGILVCPT